MSCAQRIEPITDDAPIEAPMEAPRKVKMWFAERLEGDPSRWRLVEQPATDWLSAWMSADATAGRPDAGAGSSDRLRLRLDAEPFHPAVEPTPLPQPVTAPDAVGDPRPAPIQPLSAPVESSPRVSTSAVFGVALLAGMTTIVAVSGRRAEDVRPDVATAGFAAPPVQMPAATQESAGPAIVTASLPGRPNDAGKRTTALPTRRPNARGTVESKAVTRVPTPVDPAPTEAPSVERDAAVPTAPPPRADLPLLATSPAFSGRGVTLSPAPPPPAPVVSASAPPRVTPTPVPSPASAAPPSALPASSLAESAAVRGVLNRYRGAFNALDARSVASFWPSVNTRTLDRAFAQLDEQEFTFGACDVSVAGARATATCSGQARYVPRVGSREARVEARHWTFNLRKLDGAWIIDRVTSR